MEMIPRTPYDEIPTPAGFERTTAKRREFDDLVRNICATYRIYNTPYGQRIILIFETAHTPALLGSQAKAFLRGYRFAKGA